MDTQIPESELTRIAQRIAHLADARIGNGAPFLLSTLGADLGEDLDLIKRHNKKGLKDFIQLRLSDRFTVVRLGVHGNVTGLIMKSSLPPSSDQLTISGVKQNQRFHYRFWAAFSVPPTHQVRVLNCDDFTFTDLSAAEVPEGATTISTDLIVDVSAEERDVKIKENIDKWLSAKGLSKDAFIALKRVPRLSSTLQPAGSLLHAIVAALDQRQLQSTTLSLNVVATLLRIQL